MRYAVGAVLVAVGFMSFIPFYIPLMAAIAAYLLFGIEVYKEMLSGFAKKKIFTEFTLMCVATVGAFAIGEYADAAALMYLYSLGETISGSAYASSKRNISALMEITPEYAYVLRGTEAVKVTPEEVGVGELILIRAGERVALDGIVYEGGGSADTSSVTGESKPLELYEGVECPSGAILSDGSVTLRVTKEYQSSVVFRMRRAVEEAGKRRSAAEKKITRFAAVFTPIAFCVAVLTFAVGALATGNVTEWLKSGIMVLVVACPCSLVLSVPLTYFAGLGNAARRGIVFRGGEIMDRTAKIRCVVLDKTGTITEHSLSYDGATMLSDMEREDFEVLARAVLIHSPHAAAVSFCKAVTQGDTMHVEKVENISGRGVTCEIDGKRVLFGNARLMRENGIEAQESKTTAIYGACDGRLLGRLDFSSHLKEETKEMVKRMRSLGVERIAVISGDTPEAVKMACEAAGIDEYYSSCAPDEKLCRLEEIMAGQSKRRGGSCVAFCGDGLNDSAVIAASDVGIAMGGCGSALTVESADVVLMDDSPEKINTAIAVARKTSRVANANIALSLGIKIGVVAAGAVLAYLRINVPIELAIIADVGAAVIAVLNSLRAAK